MTKTSRSPRFSKPWRAPGGAGPRGAAGCCGWWLVGWLVVGGWLVDVGGWLVGGWWLVRWWMRIYCWFILLVHDCEWWFVMFHGRHKSGCRHWKSSLLRVRQAPHGYDHWGITRVGLLPWTRAPSQLVMLVTLPWLGSSWSTIANHERNIPL